MQFDPHLVREQLDHILSSETFATSGRHSRLLRYLVDRTLAGEGEQLKEYVLGTEVFGRDASYDPRLDSIVRVEVRRLRQRLEEYYQQPGAAAIVRITIPRGSYVPVFDTPPVAPPAFTPPPQRRRFPARRIARTLPAVLAVVIIVLAAGLVVNRSRAGADATSAPGIAVLPFEHYSIDAQDALHVAQLTDAITAELAKHQTLSVTSRTTAARFAGSDQSLDQIARALSVDYVMEGSVAFAGDDLRVAIRLVHGRRDRKIWVQEYAFPPHRIAAVAPEIAAEFATVAVRLARSR